MTTTDAVAALALKPAREHQSRNRPTVAFALGAVLAATSLAGCGSSNLLGSLSEPTSVTSTQPAAAQPAPSPQAESNRSKVAVAPIMGAPDAVSKDVGAQLGSSLERQRVSLAKAGETADYTLRGYMVATKERTGTKVAYIFDLTDPAGKRVNRIQGEEMAQGGDAKNPWSAVTPEFSQRLTDKAASSLSGALASLGPSTTGSTGAPPVGVGAPANAIASQTSSVQAGPTTGSIERAGPAAAPAGAAMALVPAVVGAPGDGNTALSAAMRRELQQSGLPNASPGQRAYSVAGRVSVGAVKDGKQPVKIDWRVSDPNGGLLATVSQNNEIQAGALDGTWGGIAQEAAQGAAGKIKALIEEHKIGAASGTQKQASRTKG